MKASDAVAHVLAANNVTHGFELIGGMIAHLVDSINQVGMTKLVSLHHEQAAAFAAGGIARATNNKQIGLALATSGPGATNLVTGIADCWLDSYPCVFITGQVNTSELKGEKNIRQQGFQELDIVSIVKSITKYSVQIKSVEELIPELQKAIRIATIGRPGPVLIDIPMDLQRAEIDVDKIDLISMNGVIQGGEDLCEPPVDKEILNAIELLLTSPRPLILIGGGAVNEPSFNSWHDKVSELCVPHISSLKGSEKTIAKHGYFGMVGAYGTRTANYAVQNADVILVLGSRLDVRQTGADISDFARKAKTIIQLDIDTEQLNNRVKADVNLVASCETFFRQFAKCNKSLIKCHDWLDELNQHWGRQFINEYCDISISPFRICGLLSKNFSEKDVHFVTDVGNNQMWVAHSLLLSKNQKIHHSGGLGAMGFSIPTAIGVCYATQNIVVAITGDGGAQLNIQELDIIARENLPILTIVINNESLGMVRAFQELYFDGRNQSTYWNGYSSSFVAIAEAYNMKAIRVENEFDFDLAIKTFINDPKPLLMEVVMPDARECRPRLAFGNPIDRQFPLGD